MRKVSFYTVAICSLLIVVQANAFIENWNYTADTPLGTASGGNWPLGHFSDNAIVTDSTSYYSVRYDPLVGNFVHNDEVLNAAGEAIYLNHTDYRPDIAGDRGQNLAGFPPAPRANAAE